ncbi:MAG: serine hydrolase [Flavobacteriaceae bacterium]
MKKTTLLFALLISATCIHAQQISDEIKENIKKRVDYGDNSSIVVALLDGDKVDSFTYGKTALENGTSVNENSVYEIGSISKVFTTILLANEVESGRMKLSDPISKYLPKSVKVPSRNGKEITLKDLATHTSGLPRMPSNFAPAKPMNPFADYSVDQLYSFLSNYTLTRDIGSKYEYSNYAMGLLGHILELHTGKSYEELIAERITAPHKMSDTKMVMTTKMKAQLAIGHSGTIQMPNWDFMTLGSAGGIKSTLNDMIKFIKANMLKGNKAMQLSHQTAYKGDKDFTIGLGWHYMKTGNDEKIIWHNGRTGGYTAFTGFIEGTAKAVVVLTNSQESIDDIGLKLLDTSRKIRIPTKPLEIENTILESYVGKYELVPTFHIVITKNKGQLFLQATGQSKFQVYPSSENKFFLKVVKASITFNKDEDGKIKSLTLHQGGRDQEAKRLE